jgi:DNA-binding beta-propeller fold protein YncE
MPVPDWYAGSMWIRPFVLLIASLAVTLAACGRDDGGEPLPEGAVLVALTGDEHVVALDPAGERVLSRVQVGQEPHMIDMTPDRRTALVAVTDVGRVAVVNLDNLSVRTRVAVGDRPHQASLTPDGATAVVTNEGESHLTLIDVSRGAVSGRVDVDETPFHVRIAPDGRTAWVSYNGKDYVTLVDLESRTRIRDISLGRTPLHVSFDRAGNAWIADAQSDAILRVPPGGSAPDATFAAGRYPIEVTFTPDGGEAWVPNAVSNDVLVLDAAGGGELARTWPSRRTAASPS